MVERRDGGYFVSEEEWNKLQDMIKKQDEAIKQQNEDIDGIRSEVERKTDEAIARVEAKSKRRMKGNYIALLVSLSLISIVFVVSVMTHLSFEITAPFTIAGLIIPWAVYAIWGYQLEAK